MELLKKNAYKLVDRQMVQKLVDKAKENAPAVVEELIPEGLKIGDIQKVLKRLLKEGIPIRDLVTILETLADYCHQTKNTDVLNEYCRAALADTITKQFTNENNEVEVLMLDSSLESHLLSQAQLGKLDSSTLSMTPSNIENIYESASLGFSKMIQSGRKPILLTSPILRFTIYEFFAPILPEIVVLSYNEITPRVQFKTIDRIKIDLSNEDSSNATMAKSFA